MSTMTEELATTQRKSCYDRSDRRTRRTTNGPQTWNCGRRDCDALRLSEFGRHDGKRLDTAYACRSAATGSAAAASAEKSTNVGAAREKGVLRLNAGMETFRVCVSLRT